MKLNWIRIGWEGADSCWKMCYLSVVSFVSRVSNIKNVVNSGTWTQRNCCLFSFPSKNVFHWRACIRYWLLHADTSTLFAPSYSNHFCFGCKNVYVMKYFQFFFFLVLFVLLGNLNEQNSKAQLAWNAWNRNEWWAMSCARVRKHRHTHMHTPFVTHMHVIWRHTNIHLFVRSFIHFQVHTLFERVLQMTAKKREYVSNHQ